MNLQGIYASFDIWGAVLCLVFALTAHYYRDFDREGTKRLIRILVLNAAGLITDMMSWAIWEMTNYYTYWITAAQMSDFITNCLNFALMMVTADYIVYLIKRRNGNPHRRWRGITYTVCAIGIIGLFFSRAFGYAAMPRVWESVEAHPIIMVPYLSSFVGLMLLGYLVISEHNWLMPLERIAFTLFFVLPIFISVTEFYIYGYSPVSVGATTATVLLFVSRTKMNTEILIDQQKILTEQRLSEVEKQVRPHFIFNVLNIIYYLCASDPAKAQRAVETFSDYLRDNLKAMNAETPVPFNQELEYVKHYLSLEKLRYEEELTVCYDIRCTDFKLPVFTVQPLAENAVKHGIRYKPNGGTVNISTWESDEAYHIRVADDGVGFDPASLDMFDDPGVCLEKRSLLDQEALLSLEIANFSKNSPDEEDEQQKDKYAASPDAGNRIGLANTHTRLKLLCDGDMTITSAEGKGTTVDITIPKENNHENDRSG